MNFLSSPQVGGRAARRVTKNNSYFFNSLTYRGLPKICEAFLSKISFEAKISELNLERPLTSTKYFENMQPQINAFIPKIYVRYKLQVQIAIKSNVVSSQEWSLVLLLTFCLASCNLSTSVMIVPFVELSAQGFKMYMDCNYKLLSLSCYKNKKI